jgi:protein-tyrosine phosphatase
MRILFVCHGNICRSPMAEFVFRHLATQRGCAARYEVASAATSTEEIYMGVGNPIYPPARRALVHYGIPFDEKKRARLLTRADYAHYDLLVGMDARNMQNMHRILGGDPDGKLYKLLSFAGSARDVADPWYTGDFDATYSDILQGCTALLAHLEGEA